MDILDKPRNTVAQSQPDAAGTDEVELSFDHHPARAPSGDGKSLILLHGLGASRFSWRHVAPDWSETHDVYAVDLKGFGDSAKPGDGQYDLFTQARLVSQFMRRHELEHVTLAGNSMGGGVALALMLLDDAEVLERVKALVLISSVAYRQKFPFYLDILRKQFLGEQLLGVVPREFAMRRVLEYVFHDAEKIEKEAISTYALGLAHADGRSALVASVRQMEPENLDDLTLRYGKIGVPSLVIWGENDHVVPIETGKKLADTLPESRFEAIECCGHLPQEERPEAVSGIVKEFLTHTGL